MNEFTTIEAMGDGRIYVRCSGCPDFQYATTSQTWAELNGAAHLRSHINEMPTAIRVVVDAFHGKLVGVHGELDPRQVAS